MTGSKKKSIGKLFVVSLMKSLVAIVVLLLAGFGSYKVSYYFLSKNATDVKTDEDSIKEILKEAQTEDISKNLIYVCNEKDQITHMMVEICNTNTHNMDYITIPTKNDYTIPSTMYRKLCTISENIPQIIRVSRLKQYFDDEEQAYGYGLLIVEKMIGTSLSYYTVLDQETYDNHYQQVKVKVSYKKTNEDATVTASPYSTATPVSASAKTKMKISCASDAYVNQLKDIQGDETKIADFIKAQYDRVNSNLTVTNKIGYIKSYEEMNVDFFHYWGCPGSYDGKIFVVDTKAAKKFIKSLVNNEVPYTEAQDLTTLQKATVTPVSANSNKSSKSSKKSKKVSSKGKKILVLNGSKINGLAGKTQQKLQEAGYTVPKVGDYTTETLTVTKIIVKEEGQGEDLAEYFKDPKVTVGMVEEGYDIEIIVGTTDANQ